MRPSGHEFIRPDMIAVLRPEPDTGVLVDPLVDFRPPKID